MSAATTAHDSIAGIGYQALQNGGQDNNIAIGYQAGQNITSARYNVIIGDSAGNASNNCRHKRKCNDW